MDVEWWACGTVLIWQVRKPPINLSKTPTISRSGRWIQLYFLGCCMSLQSSLWPQAESGHHVLVARWFYDDGGFHRVFIGCGGVRITPWQCSRHKHAPLQQRVYFANTKAQVHWLSDSARIASSASYSMCQATVLHPDHHFWFSSWRLSTSELAASKTSQRISYLQWGEHLRQSLQIGLIIMSLQNV